MFSSVLEIEVNPEGIVYFSPGFPNPGLSVLFPRNLP